MFFEYYQNIYVVASFMDYKDKVVRSSLERGNMSVECYLVSCKTVGPTYIDRITIERCIGKFGNHVFSDSEKDNLVLTKDGLLAYVLNCYTSNPNQKTLIVLDPPDETTKIGQRITSDITFLNRIPNKLKIELKNKI